MQSLNVFLLASGSVFFFLCFGGHHSNCQQSFAKKQTKEQINNFKQKKRFEDSRVHRLDPPVIQTAKGKIAGKKVNIDSDELLPTIQYLGVPYAKPPTGNLRWKKPEEHGVWQGILNATEFKPICPQVPEKLLLKSLLPVWYHFENEFKKQFRDSSSEDCLYLNIYVPATFYAQEPNFTHAKTKLPVMVYFHGHTFSDGSGNFYDASVLASYGEVIVITFNYRLGVFGFLSTGNPSSPGNYGLWDQIKAMEWISTYIENFGGNRSQITAFGSGAGAASIGLLMLSDINEGSHIGNLSQAWFKRAILQSGFSTSPWSLAKHSQENAIRLAAHPKINCSIDLSEDTMSCLRQKSWKDIVAVPFETKPYQIAFGPVVDGHKKLLKHNPRHLLKEGEFTDYAIIFGVSQNDGYSGMLQVLKSKYNFNSATILDNFKFASKVSFDQYDFDQFFSSFIRSYFDNITKSSAYFIQEISKFFYTDWLSHYKVDSSKWKNTMMDIYSDTQFVEPAYAKLTTHSAHNHFAYFYTFNAQSDFGSDRTWIGSSLGEELPYTFGVPFLRTPLKMFSYNFSKSDKILSAALMTYWTNFAKTDSPTNFSSSKARNLGVFEKQLWPRYKHNTRAYLSISPQPQVRSHHRSKKVQFWNRLLPKLLKFGDVDIMSATMPSVGGGARSYNTTLLKNRSRINLNKTLPINKTTQRTFTTKKANVENLSADNLNDGNSMSTQLSMTLAVGFVLLFANIIAFAIISYRKEQDKIAIQTLKSDLNRYKKRSRQQRTKTRCYTIPRTYLKRIPSDSVIAIRQKNQRNHVLTCSTCYSHSEALFKQKVFDINRYKHLPLADESVDSSLKPICSRQVFTSAGANPTNRCNSDTLITNGFSTETVLQNKISDSATTSVGKSFEDSTISSCEATAKYNTENKAASANSCCSEIFQLSSLSMNENESFERRKEAHIKSSLEVHSIPVNDSCSIDSNSIVTSLLLQESAISDKNHAVEQKVSTKRNSGQYRCFDSLPLHQDRIRQAVSENYEGKICTDFVTTTELLKVSSAVQNHDFGSKPIDSELVEKPNFTFSTIVTKL